MCKFARKKLIYLHPVIFIHFFFYSIFFRGEICCWGSAQRRNDGHSVILRARVGQKCDFRGILKNSVDKLEAIVGLRSGGLPVAHQRKIFEDHIDLSVTMRDILYSFFKSNQYAPDDLLHQTFVLGVQSWGK